MAVSSTRPWTGLSALTIRCAPCSGLMSRKRCMVKPEINNAGAVAVGNNWCVALQPITVAAYWFYCFTNDAKTLIGCFRDSLQLLSIETLPVGQQHAARIDRDR